MSSRFRLYGAQEMKDNLNAAARRSPKVLERSLKKFANIEMTEMKRQTPVEFGTLRDSGHVEEPVWNGNVLTIELGFGGAAELYAAIVHEDLDAHHDVGNAKFVERPLMESEPYFAERVITDWAREMGML